MKVVKKCVVLKKDFSFNLFPNSKKGISIMIGYILLITMSIIISGVVFQWAKTYVPADPIECPSVVSVFV